MKPVWLLDVDGVINACSYTADAWPKYDQYTVKSQGRFWDIRVAQEVLDFINLMAEHVDIRWLTTWEHDANADLRHQLTLPRFPLAGERMTVNSTNWWKDPIASRVALATGAPMIWTDDDIPFYGGDKLAAKWTQERLLIAPKTWDGLTHEHLKEIEEFVERVS